MENSVERDRPEDVKEPYSDDTDSVSISALLTQLWVRRRSLFMQSLVYTLIIIAVGSAFYFSRTKTYVAEINFRILFDGIDKNQYPNELPFSTADILNTPILKAVFERNDLQKFIDFQKFKAGLAIIQTNEQLQFLEYEYAEKLGSRNLTAESRKKLEEEFMEKRRSAMVPVYRLTFSGQGIVDPIPWDLVHKSLVDILNTWAVYADQVKGSNKYQVFTVSPSIINEDLIFKSDFLVATDFLRLTIKRCLQDIKTLKAIPGASNIRTAEGGVSLRDLEFRLLDIEKFLLSPIAGLIRQGAISRDLQSAMGYLENQIFRLKIDLDQAEASRTVYENSFKQYLQRSAGQQAYPSAGSAFVPGSNQGMGNVPAMIPQFGADFLENLLQMGKEMSDAKFRQDLITQMTQEGLKRVDAEAELKFYKEVTNRIDSALSGAQTPTQKAKLEEAQQRIMQTHEITIAELRKIADKIREIYESLSRLNLNPENVAYQLIGPAQVKAGTTLPASKILVGMVLSWLLCAGVSVAVALMMIVMQEKREDSAHR
jgi:hypothetical protein